MKYKTKDYQGRSERQLTDSYKSSFYSLVLMIGFGVMMFIFQ